MILVNYYELLGVSKDVTEEEIRKAYKIQMKKWHPDINQSPDAMDMSMKINEAKEVLLDPLKRKDYDDFLNKKEEQTYQRYSNYKQPTKETPQEEVQVEPQEKMVTKWEYLREYLKNKNINIFRRIIGLIFVLLESFLCFIIKYLIIGLTFLCFFLSDIIIIAYNYLYPLVILLIIYTIYLWQLKGIDSLLTNNKSQIIAIIVLICIYLSNYLLVIIGKKLLSQKVFDFLYNKLDVFLFKKSVGI